jgi:hypothetical protein
LKFATAQAMAYYRWVNHAQASAPPEKPPLLVNADETALAHSFTGGKGTVVCAKSLPTQWLQASENVDTEAAL